MENYNTLPKDLKENPNKFKHWFLKLFIPVKFCILKAFLIQVPTII